MHFFSLNESQFKPKNLFGFIAWSASILLLGCGRAEWIDSEEILSLRGEWDLVSEIPSQGPEIKKKGEKVTIPFDFSSESKYEDFDGCILLKHSLPEKARTWMNKQVGVAIDTGHSSDVAEFYLNEISKKGKIGQIGSRDPYSSGQDGRIVSALPASAFLLGEENHIYSKICTASGRPFFWRGPEVSVGTSAAIFRSFALELSVAFLLAAVYISVGLYHLLLSIRRPSDIFNLYFGCFALFFAFFHMTNNASAEILYGSHKNIQSVADQVSLMGFIGSLLLFISRFFLGKHSKLAVGVASAYLGIAFLDIFVSHNIRLFLLQVVEISMLFTLPYILFVTGREAWRGNPDARLLLGGVALIIVGGIHDLAVEQRVIRSILIMPYTFLAFILGIAFILANRFVRVHNEVEELNASLEEKVRKRTDDLQKSLSEIKELKHQQDGDYFLTSQLMQPLAGNYANSDVVRAEILCRQKKRFQFRNWQGELGGDLCAVYSLKLRGRSVLVFFNGDAMGKSMQGAGGALIMGTVFKTIVTRTQSTGEMQDLFPEHWLKRCYQELKSVFVTFDGRMLISMVVGIVDEATGLLYFINAEHPRVVLYRDGKADFVSEGGMLRKVGVEDPSEVFVVQTLSLRPNDAILIGSDGRDDLQLGTNEDGNQIINEDENAFLKDVEEANSELLQVESLLRARGQIIDDLSLIRIGYKEDLPSVQDILDDPFHSEPKSPEDSGRNKQKKALRNGIEEKDYLLVASEGQRYLEQFPEDSSVYLWVSYALARLGNYEQAINFGEVLFLRDPDHIKNREHLGKLHQKNGNRTRAEILLGKKENPT
ncbi:stage II sporulation protein E [Leptospira wolffii]|uniref:SpoIIE family protein phosphatase n=1 Tax=Leptospira wolffii TaxID=409998 RepID=UPI0002D95ADD|nr:SpoIIE family protein phosphatase [Leptospira wolffii]EPG66627.1 SpoIIE-like protein phosphatase domain protein [Leptospira wolffii serovar Khorat str. Khorat-H2]TGL55428.1 stage II sporulation protein E [Leptospira wolffii]